MLRRKKKRRKPDDEEIVKVPKSWMSRKDPSSSRPGKQMEIVRTQHKVRIPGLLMMKRILAGILLLINFAISQFLLGTLGNAVQPLFMLFLANSFILADYLWKTRRKEK